MAAPKGNKFAIGNSGREKIFDSVSELQSLIDEYFDKCDSRTKEVFDKNTNSTKTISQPMPYTVEGLCSILKCERQTLLNYEKQEGYEEFFDTIKNAKLKIQQNKVERALLGDAPSTFAIFDIINNTDYKNTTHAKVEQTVTTLPPILEPLEFESDDDSE